MSAVLSRLQSFGLTINKEKCEFGKHEIEFYGRRFTESGLTPSPEKVKVLKECGEPTSKEGVRCFLRDGWLHVEVHSKFLSGIESAEDFDEGNTQFQWGQKEREAFNRLKACLTEETSLAYFIPNQPIRVQFDAGKKMERTSNVPGGLCASGHEATRFTSTSWELRSLKYSPIASHYSICLITQNQERQLELKGRAWQFKDWITQ